jgi:Ni/Co efflux regulator RcnB
MKRSLIVLALAACGTLPALAQQATNCDPSGYVTGVQNGQDVNHTPCDTRSAPRVNGVPQAQQAQPNARRGYNNEPARQYTDQRDPRYVNNYDNRYDNRNYDNRDWQRYRGEGNYYYGARGPEWRRGGHVPRQYMDRQYWVEDWRGHHLSAPPRGYRWVQVGDDYVLVAIASGIIAQLLLAQ